jgi:Protein of unknown function (DUF1559)
LTVVNYHDVQGHYPQPYLTDSAGLPTQSWRLSILPYIEQEALLKEYVRSEAWDGPTNSQLAPRMPRTYALHGDYRPGTTTTNYLAIVGSETVWPLNKKVTNKDVKDGASNTLLIVENRGLNIHWMEPRDLDFDTMDWTIDSPHGVSSKYDSPAVVFLDGSVRRLSKKLSPEAVRAMATIAAGDAATEDGELIQVLPDGRDRPVTKP